jgi:hypothetical protein
VVAHQEIYQTKSGELMPRSLLQSLIRSADF